MVASPIALYPSHPSIEICIKQYDPSLSFFLATLCYQAKILSKYPTYFTIPTFPETYQFVTSLQSSATGFKTGFGYVLESPSSIYMVFRGSASYSDLYMDVNAFLVPFPLVQSGGSVHNGFYSIYTATTREHPYSLRNEVIGTLSKLDPSKKLYISGFSLGGALAILCTLDIAINTPFTSPILYTFASPRVGNKDFTTKFNQTIQQSFRVVNSYDFVPNLPPPIYGYRHVKNRIELQWNAGSIQDNHGLTKAYIPALYYANAGVGKEICKENPPSFCPNTIPRARL